jgi:hypothetical protein
MKLSSRLILPVASLFPRMATERISEQLGTIGRGEDETRNGCVACGRHAAGFDPGKR